MPSLRDKLKAAAQARPATPTAAAPANATIMDRPLGKPCTTCGSAKSDPAPERNKVGKSQTVLFLSGRSDTKPYTARALDILRAGGWDVHHVVTDPKLVSAKSLIEKTRAAVCIRWEEHGRLFSTKHWANFVLWCYRHNCAPLSLDLGYFDHYNTLMIDRYRPDGHSAILDELDGMPVVTQWNGAPDRLKQYRDSIRQAWDAAANIIPVKSANGVSVDGPGYVLLFLQYATTLARPPFAAKDMADWASMMIGALQGAGFKVVVKTSPVSTTKPDHAIFKGVPVFTDPNDNVSLLRHAAWSLILCSSVSNLMTLLDLPVTATGRSWFTGLNVFTEPADMASLTATPTVNAARRGQWVNWWLRRQFYEDQLPTALAAAVERFRAVPYDYKSLYTTVYKETPSYHAARPRQDRMLDAVTKLAGVAKVLDVGCGSGKLVEALLGRGLDAYGVDVAKIERTGPAAERCVEGNALKLDYPDASFDAVTCMDMLEHLRAEDIPKAVAECARVSRKHVLFSFGASASAHATPAGWPALHQTVKTFPQWVEYVKSMGLSVKRTEFTNSVCNLAVCEKSA